MFNRRVLRDDLPAIDIRMKNVKSTFGFNKQVSRSVKEQRSVKKELMRKYPDRWFIDDLHEYNSKDSLSWIDRIEEYLASTDDN